MKEIIKIRKERNKTKNQKYGGGNPKSWLFKKISKIGKQTNWRFTKEKKRHKEVKSKIRKEMFTTDLPEEGKHSQ